MEDIKVSIVCITYNHGKYIRDALDGFVMQKTNFKYEVLIHDDASTDDTADIIREYEERYPEIIKPIYQSENQYSKGIKVAVNFNMPRITGKYVAFCEGDDFWIDENKLQKQADFLDMHPECSAHVHAYKRLDMRDGSAIEINSFPYNGVVSANEVIEGDGGLFATNSIMCRTEIYKDIPYFREIAKVGDYPLMIHLAFAGNVYYENTVMSCYRYMVPGSWSSRNMVDDEKKKRHLEEAQIFLEEADRYSEYKYHKSFQYIIDKKWFAYYSKSKSLFFLKKNFGEFYSRFSVKDRIYMHLSKYAPFILKIRSKIRKK